MQDEDLGVNLATLDPDNLPEDMEALIAQLGGDTSDINTEPTEEPEEDEKPEAPESSTEAQEEEEAPILSADGKHAIPYTVLKQEREARRAAAEHAAELQREAARLQDELQTLKQAKQEGIATPTETFDTNDPEIQALESEFPEIARANRAARAEIERLRQEMQLTNEKLAKLDQLEAVAEAYEREQEALARKHLEEVETAIDANITLRYLRSGDGNEHLWDAAVQIDKELQNRPAWANKPIAERFAKVVERLEEDFGPVKVPGKYKVAVIRKPPEKTEEKEDLMINTLSDIRGGSSPESDDLNLSSASALDIQSMLQRMTPKQQDEWLSRLA